MLQRESVASFIGACVVQIVARFVRCHVKASRSVTMIDSNEREQRLPRHYPRATSIVWFFSDIFKRANHSGTEKDVFSVEILGELQPDVWHHIADARAAGEAAFAELQGGMTE